MDQKYEEALTLLAEEKAENKKLTTDLENLNVHFAELEATNNHLIAATWRERDLKKKLSDTLDELNKTKELVENQNRRITESINYARKIQLAINPTEADLKAVFPESFILYLPKDVISGDFPWLFTIDRFIYVAAVDCTGHGVPGAMMSMIGNLLLNDIINNGSVLLPSEILSKLHHAVVNTLKQNLPDSNSNDGMDISLCRIDRQNREILHSGAHRPLFFMRGGEIEILSGDKFPIGGIHYKGLNTYTDQVKIYEEHDSVFLFTDGFPDQIGGEDNRKLLTRNLKTFIAGQSGKNSVSIKEELMSYYSHWKGGSKQIDDILLIGITF